MTPNFRTPLYLGLSAFAGAAHSALILDDFDSDTSANYTLVDETVAASGDGTPDSRVTFGYDYSAAGIPSAPNSTGGSTIGVQMAVNITPDDAGAPDHVTIYNTTALSGSYRLTVDMYMNVGGPSGSTEFGTVGIGGATNDFNSIFTPIAGNGHFLSVTGDGGSSSDFRHFIQPINPVASGDASYLNDLNTTNSSGDTYQNIFPGGDFTGSPGNRWTTLTIDVIEGGNVTYSFDGTPIVRTPTVANEGLAGLGYADSFASVGGDIHFVVYDNLLVEAIPEPSSALLSLLSAALLLRRRR